MSYDIFISYSRKDTPIANRICEALNRQGINYFIDRKGISGGKDFPEIISDAILNCRILLFLASQNSYESKYTKKEITFAINEKPSESILPYIIDGNKLPISYRFNFSDINIRTIKEHPVDTTLMEDICLLLGRQYKTAEMLKQEKEQKRREQEEIRLREQRRKEEALKLEEQKKEEEKLREQQEKEGIKLREEREKEKAILREQQEEAKRLRLKIENAKWMLSDMKQHPTRYSWKDMHRIVCEEGLLSRKEIIANGILSEKQMDIIQDYPNPFTATLPNEIVYEDDKDHTDIYLIGVPGSGKSSILAGLFSALNMSNDYVFRILMYGKEHNGYTCAVDLQNAVNYNIFPLRTPINDLHFCYMGDDEYKDRNWPIYVIDAEIGHRSEERHKLSFVEMAGEYYLQLAINQNLKGVTIGSNLAELIKNNNHKLFFFVIDPSDTNYYPVNLGHNKVIMTQAQVLSAVVDMLINMTRTHQLKNLDAVHVILSKADLLGFSPHVSKDEQELFNSRLSELTRGSFAPLVNALHQLCSQSDCRVNAHCGRKPYLYPFSLGQMLPGGMYNYIPYTSERLLDVIRGNTIIEQPQSSFLRLLSSPGIKPLRPFDPILSQGYEL